MLSFYEYASHKRITELLIKERIKIALDSKLRYINTEDIPRKVEVGEHLSITEFVFTLMPPRNSWVRPAPNSRRKKDSKEPKTKKQILTRALALTIKKHRKTPSLYPYLERMDSYIDYLRGQIVSEAPLHFRSIRIVGQHKKFNNKVDILRPLCLFEDLTEKLLVSLANRYLREVFDGLLHEEILSYRPLRTYHNSAEPVITDRDNAIENLQYYRAKHKRMYVAECDIQKYFDTINHDVVRRCFSEFARRLKEKHPDFDYSSVGRIVDAYLDSYSFYNNVVVLNKDLMRKNPPQRYEEPKRELFISRGCYTEQEFAASQSKIGVPQGGALSSLISNVVLSTIDYESILKHPDKNRYFCRYGDDIMLIHTSKKRCQQLIDDYCVALTTNKLLYHDFVSVADSKYRYSDGTVRPALWDIKSRSPFLWGRSADEKESVDWIGFLGYEVRYTGEVRLRRSTLDDKFKRIKRTYYSGAKTKMANGEREFKKDRPIDIYISRYIDRFAGEGLSGSPSLTKNKFTLLQAQKLNQYTSSWLYRLIYKIARNNNLPKEDVEKWWQYAKERGCMNYTKTIK